MADGSHLKLGQIINEPQERDAIHIAVVPVVASEMLRPGQKVGVRFGEGGWRAVTDVQPTVGVIDPFLNRPVAMNQKCWLYLNPGSINSLRHEWTHWAFDEKTE